jgi:nucleotide-binding universal stress UspA family protein
VVAGIDDSAEARRAAVWAASEADRTGTSLRLVHAFETITYTASGGFVPPPAYVEAVENAGREMLEAARREAQAAHPQLAVEVDMCPGQPVAVLLDESQHASMVVLGVKELSGVQRLTMFSTAVSLAAHAQCPVAVIRSAVTGPASDGPVVVGVDGTPASEEAVRIAFEEASARRLDLVAVHAWTEFVSDREFIYARQFALDLKAVHTREQEILAERLAGWQEKFPDVTVERVVSPEKPVKALLDATAGAQLLVVGSRGRGGFTGMLLGSTSRKLIHYASCPLLVVRPHAA